MRFKNQNSSALRWLLKHHLFLTVISFTLVFALVPLHGMMKMNTVKAGLETYLLQESVPRNLQLHYTKQLTEDFLFFPLNLELLCLLFGFLGFGSALVLFGHLFSRKQSMMHAGLPIRKSQDFINRTLAFLILTAVPVALCLALYPLLVRAEGVWEYFDSCLYARRVLVLMLIVLYGYAVGTLAAGLFGTLWAAALGSLLLGGSAEVLYTVWKIIAKSYLHTMVFPKMTDSLIPWSPLVSLYKSAYKPMDFFPLPGIAAILFLTGLGFLVFQRNRPENAGTTLNIRKIEIPGLILVTLLGGSAGALVFAVSFSREISLYLGILAGSAAVYLASRILVEQNIRIHSFQWGIPASCAALMLLCCLGLRIDPLGYDSYLPPEADLTAVTYVSDQFSDRTVRLEEKSNLQAARSWFNVAREEMLQQRAVKPWRPVEMAEVTVTWETGSRSVRRRYKMPEDGSKAVSAVESIVNSREFQLLQAAGVPEYTKLEGVRQLETHLWLDTDAFIEVYGFSPVISQSTLDTDSVRAALRKDLEKQTLEDMQEQTALNLYFYDVVDEQYFGGSGYRITAANENVIQALFGDRADRVIRFLRGEIVENQDTVVMECTYDREGYQRKLVGVRVAQTPEEAKAWLRNTTSCENHLYRMPLDPLRELRIYSRARVKAWIQENPEGAGIIRPDVPESWPEESTLYTFYSLNIRANRTGGETDESK